MPDPNATSLPRKRRRSRLETLVNPPRAFAAVAFLAALALPFLTPMTGPWWQPAVLVGTNVLLGMAAAFGLATGQAWTFVLGLITVAAWVVFAAIDLDPSSEHSLLVGIVAGACLLTAVLAPIRWFSPAKVALFVMTVAVGAVVVNQAANRRLAQMKPIFPPPPASRTLFAEVPELGWTGLPHTAGQEYYPSNPRGYFEPTTYLGPVDMRLWHWNRCANGPLEVKIPEDPRGILTVRVLTDPGDCYTSINYAPLILKGGQQYVASFRARAESPRTLPIRVQPGVEPFKPFCLNQTITLSRGWRTFSFVFSPDADFASHWFVFEPDKQPSTIEISDLAVWPAKHEAFSWGKPRDGSWTIRQHAGCTGEMDVADNQVRTTITKTDGVSWHVQFETNGWPVVADQPIRFQCRVRGDKARSISTNLSRAHGDYRDMALNRDIPVTTSWTDYKTTFISSISDENARICFNVGDQLGWVELADVQFEPAEATPAQSKAPGYWRLADPRGASQLFADPPSAPTARWTGQANDQPMEGVLYRDQVPVEPGRRVAISFFARAGKSGQLELAARAAAGGPLLGRLQRFDVRAEWRKHYAEFPAPTDDLIRLEFVPAGGLGSLEIRDLIVSQVDGPSGPLADRFAVTYRFNRDGFRDRDWSESKPADTFRIAVLGDSFTCGMGTHENDTFPRQLEAYLNRTRPTTAPRYEVMNFGIPGWDTVQERRSYQQVARRYHPDLVLLVMVSNDDMSASEEQAAGLCEPPAKEGPGVLKLLKSAGRGDRPGFARPCEEALALNEELKKDKSRFAIVLYITGETDEWKRLESQVTAGLAGSGIPMINVWDKLSKERDIFVHAIDLHPNDVAHRVSAEAVGRFLRAEKLVPAGREKQREPSPSPPQ